MKKMIITVACTLIALLAFAQPGSKGTKTTTEPTITVTGTIIPSAIEEGATASYQPAKTLVVREDRSNNPGRYVLNERGSRCEQNRRSHPNRDQTWHSGTFLLRKHGRFAYG